MNLLYNFSNADSSAPSFFEMFLESMMMPSLKPALDYMLDVMAQRNPNVYPLIQYSDEIFYTCVFILERHYLKHYDGSFSENFYGLKRAIVTMDGKKGPPLQRKHKLWSLFFLVAVPYIKTKLDKYYQEEFENPVHYRRNMETMSTKKVFGVCYPYFIAFYEALFFVYQLLYMYGETQYYTPFLHLQGLTIKRQTVSDLVRLSRKVTYEQKQRQRTKHEKSKLILLCLLMVDWANIFLDYSQYILPTGIFLFKFLEWWYNEPRFQNTTDLIPPPPEPPKRHVGGLNIPEDLSLCPICLKKRTNPAMATSGFVYCYPCLFKHIEKNHKCPITHIHMEVDQIRKIYDNSS